MISELPGAYLAFAAIVGMLIGSFLNVCIYRLPRDLSVATPRSFCPGCGEPVAWFDNVPVVSYVVLRGRCRTCGQSIAWRYPVVEIVTGILFALVGWRYGMTVAALKWCVLEALVVALFWTDLEERLLPDELTIGGCIAGLAFAAVIGVPGSLISLVLSGIPMPWRGLTGAVLGSLFLSMPVWGLGALWGKVRKIEALGLGDVKLLSLIGAFLGVEAGLPALMIGAVSGLIAGVIYILVTKQSFRTYQLPFGSFLCLGAGLMPVISKL